MPAEFMRTGVHGGAVVITSQRYLNGAVVAGKDDGNREVMVSPAFAINGVNYRMLQDGHHRLAAALRDGADVELYESSYVSIDGGTYVNAVTGELVYINI